MVGRHQWTVVPYWGFKSRQPSVSAVAAQTLLYYDLRARRDEATAAAIAEPESATDTADQ